MGKLTIEQQVARWLQCIRLAKDYETTTYADRIRVCGQALDLASYLDAEVLIDYTREILDALKREVES